MDSVLTKIVNEISEKTGRTPKEIEDIYTMMFQFIKTKADALDFSKLETEEDFRKAKTNFNIPRILKLYATPNRVEYVKNKIRESNSKHVQGVDSDNNPEGGE
jgi:hypothetical protein